MQPERSSGDELFPAAASDASESINEPHTPRREQVPGEGQAPPFMLFVRRLCPRALRA